MHDYIKLEHANPKHKDILVVNWCLGNTCSFSCSYCPTNLHDGSRSWISLVSVIRFINNVNEHYGDKNIYFEFTGGEVSLYKDFQKLIQYLKSRDMNVGIISNLSRTTRFWEDVVENLDHMNASFHPEFTDPNHFLEVVKILQPTTGVHVNIMMKPENFKDCLKFAQRVVEIEDVTISLQPLLVDFGSHIYEYTDEQKEIMSNMCPKPKITSRFQTYKIFRGEMKKIYSDGREEITTEPELVSNNENNWKGWSCNAGIDELVINYDGNIYRGWCKQGGTIGNVDDRHIEFPTNAIICQKDFCHCNLDIMNERLKI